MSKTGFRVCSVVAALCGIVAMPTGLAAAESVAEFYSGKTITVVVAAGPGGGHSVYTQLIAPTLKKNMPGNPTFIVQNMGGAGGVKAANYLAGAAPQDGSYLGILLQDTPMAARLRPSGTRYDPAKFHFLGGADVTRSAFVISNRAGVTSIEDVKTKEVLMGSTGKGSQTFVVPTLANALIGTKFKIVLGYNGMGDIYQAIDRGEVHGFQSVWSPIAALRPHWIEQKFVTVLAAASTDRLPDRPDAPLLIDLVKDPKDKEIFDLVAVTGVIGRCWLAPPDAPKDRVAALRAAFAKTLADPAVAEEAKKRNLTWEPVKWQDLQAAVSKIVKADEATYVRMRQILGLPAS